VSDEQWAAIMAGEPIWDEKLRDQKPAKRIKATADEWKKLRAAKLDRRACRTCGAQARSLHHIVSKSLRGDDVENNLVGLCGTGTTGCHGLIESREPWARSLLGQRLTLAERTYVISKKGAGWLAVHYGVREAA
jgi:hypothetical protein